jgi:lipopolysaccharide transport system permease protein
MSTITFNPLHISADIWRNRYLLGQLIKRDVLLRYRGAMFGVLWIFLSPLLMLGIFAFVFGHIFQARWPQQHEGMPFWLILYSGLIVFNIFAEAVSRSPAAVRGNPNFVKKIIFPVNILPLVPLGAGLVHGAFNFIILLAALAWTGNLHVQVLLFPLLLVPALLLALGFVWFLAAWGVFIKDMTQIVPLFVQMLMFLSPVFYPVSAVPEMLRPLYLHNPLGAVIESGRAAALGMAIPWSPWVTAFAIGLAAAILGYAFFQHSREEFADAL